MIYASKEEREQALRDAVTRIRIGPVVVVDHYVVAEIGPISNKRFVALPCFALEFYKGTLEDALMTTYEMSTGCFSAAKNTYRCDYSALQQALTTK